MIYRIEFYVPLSTLVGFVEVMTKASVDNEIIGLTEENELIIYAEYEDAQGDAIAQLTEMVDYYDYEEEEGDEDDE